MQRQILAYVIVKSLKIISLCCKQQQLFPSWEQALSWNNTQNLLFSVQPTSLRGNIKSRRLSEWSFCKENMFLTSQKILPVCDCESQEICWKWFLFYIACTFANILSHCSSDKEFLDSLLSLKPLFCWDLPLQTCIETHSPLSSLSLPCSSTSFLLWFNNDLSFVWESHLESQNHRMVEGGMDLGGSLYNSPAQTRSSKASYPGPCPDGFWISSGMETPQFWTTCASAQSLSQEKSVSQSLKGTSCVSASACCLLWTLSNHRITEWLGLEGTSESSSSNPSAMGWGTFH